MAYNIKTDKEGEVIIRFRGNDPITYQVVGGFITCDDEAEANDIARALDSTVEPDPKTQEASTTKEKS